MRMHIEFTREGMPELVGALPGFALIRCRVEFNSNRQGQLVLGSGKAKITVRSPVGKVSRHIVSLRKPDIAQSHEPQGK